MNKDTCLNYTEVEHCIAEEENKCSQCEDGYSPSYNGLECVKNSLNLRVVISIPVVADIIILLIIIVIVLIIVFENHSERTTKESRTIHQEI